MKRQYSNQTYGEGNYSKMLEEINQFQEKMSKPSETEEANSLPLMMPESCRQSNVYLDSYPRQSEEVKEREKD